MYSVAPPPEAVSALTVYPGTKVQSQWLRDQSDREACEQRERRHAPNTRCQRKYRYDHYPLQAGAQHQLQQRRPRRHHTAAQRDIRGQSASRHHTSPAHKHRQRSRPARHQEDRRHQRYSGHLVGRCPQNGAAASSDRIQHAAPGSWRKRRDDRSQDRDWNENHPAKPQKYNSPRFCGATATHPRPRRWRQTKTIDPVAKNATLHPRRTAAGDSSPPAAAREQLWPRRASGRLPGTSAKQPRSFICTCDAPSSSSLGDSRFRSPGPQPGLRLVRHILSGAGVSRPTPNRRRPRHGCGRCRTAARWHRSRPQADRSRCSPGSRPARRARPNQP